MSGRPRRGWRPPHAITLCCALGFGGVLSGGSRAVAQESGTAGLETPQEPATAEEPAAATETAPDSAARPEPLEAGGETRRIGRESALALIRDANPMLLPLVICSIVAVGFSLERWIALRRGRVIPKEFVDRFLDRLSTGKLDRDRALELCRAHESPIARVFGHAIRYWGQPSTTIRQAVDADAASEVSELKRNVRVLNGTTTLAPLLGLLGTVVGLIEAFDALGGPDAAGTPKGEALAHGISLALVATAFGLVIAVYSGVAYYLLLNRVDVVVKEMDDQVRKVIELVAAESWPGADRRSGYGMTPAERARPESRAV